MRELMYKQTLCTHKKIENERLKKCNEILMETNKPALGYCWLNRD